MKEVRVLYLCDGKACGKTCPNKECHHTEKFVHALHKDADLDSFDHVPSGDDVMVLVEPYDGE